MPWWVSFQKSTLETTRGSTRKVRQGSVWESRSALLWTPGTLVAAGLARPGGGKASVQTGKGWNQSRSDKGMTKYTAGPGSTLPRSCFWGPKRATTPPQNPTRAASAYPYQLLSPVWGSPAAVSLLASPQNSTMVHTSQTQAIPPVAPQGWGKASHRPCPEGPAGSGPPAPPQLS